jgi:endo-beta-N-acetylglucosaminidase D
MQKENEINDPCKSNEKFKKMHSGPYSNLPFLSILFLMWKNESNEQISSKKFEVNLVSLSELSLGNQKIQRHGQIVGLKNSKKIDSVSMHQSRFSYQLFYQNESRNFDFIMEYG